VDSADRREVVVMTELTVGFEPSRRTARRNFVRHFLEMVVAMLIGMALLGAVARMIFAALGNSGFLLDHAGLRATVMAANMTIGMAVWMRYRRHGWEAIAEMGAAMFVPLMVLIGPFWAGVLSGGALLGWMHALMLPAMVIAMQRRRDEYARDHHRHVATTPSQSAAT
jgi:hypothetical protein